MNTQNAFEFAFELHLKGDLVEAENIYRNLLSQDPLNTEARHYLGVLLHQKGDTQAGLPLILSALESDTGSAYRYNDLGNIYTVLGELSNAAAAFRLSLDLNVKDSNVWNNLGSVLHRQKNINAAENAYRSALTYDNHFVPALNNLAALLAENGCIEESSWYECLAYIQPPHTEKSLIRLGSAYYRLNRLGEAAECYRTWLKTDPDNAFARHHLAACTGEAVPHKASNSYLKIVFNSTADRFDKNLVEQLLYRGPEIIADLLKGHLVNDNTLDVLDGGCGTGLCAPVLAPYAKSLTGVDISSGMLGKANTKGFYNALVEMELAAYLINQQQVFDLICLADTLVYFGDLTELFRIVRRALRPRGMFVFTVECAAESKQAVGYQLNPSGRYAHSDRYVSECLEKHHFSIKQVEEVNIRMEIGQPTPGLGILAQALPPG